MTDADARVREIAERIAHNIADVAEREKWNIGMRRYILDAAVPAIAAALRERPTSYAAGIEDAARVANLEWFSGDRWRTASVLGPAIEAAIRALAPEAEAEKLETTAEERAQYRSYGVGFPSQDSFATRMVSDFDRLLASHKGEREDG